MTYVALYSFLSNQILYWKTTPCPKYHLIMDH